MGDRRSYLIQQIVKYSLKLDEKGFGANHDGNISARLDDVLLATPTAVSKGNMLPEMIITLDKNGKKIEGMGNPFSEIKLHLVAYRVNEKAKAVVHAHPPFATARGLIGLPIMPALPEAIVSLGEMIPVAPFAMPGDAENDSIMASMLALSNAFMIAGNGVIAIGENVEQAYLRVELIEHLAKIDFYARQMGAPMTLSNEQQHALLAKRSAAGLDPVGQSETASVEMVSTEKLSQLVLEKLKEYL